MGFLQILTAEKSWRDFVDEDYLKVQLAIEQDLPLTEGSVLILKIQVINIFRNIL